MKGFGQRAVLVIVAVVAACSNPGVAVPTPVDLQADLARHSVVFTLVGEGVSAESRGDVVGRATRGSGMPFRSAIWVFPGEVTAQGNQGQALVDRSVWAVYFSGVEQFMFGAPGVVRSDWVVFVDTDTDTIVLGPVTAGVTTVDTCPPRAPAVSFEIQLPNRGVHLNAGGEWVLGVVPADPARLTVVVTVAPAVVIESLSFVVQSIQFGRELWRHPAGTHLQEGTYQFTFDLDGSGLPRGLHRFVALWDVERDDGVPCRFEGDRSGAGGEQGLGWLDIDGP